MFDIFLSLFSHSLVDLVLNPPQHPSGSAPPTHTVIMYATINTIIRATVLAGFTYGAIRVVITAVSHGSF